MSIEKRTPQYIDYITIKIKCEYYQNINIIGYTEDRNEKYNIIQAGISYDDRNCRHCGHPLDLNDVIPEDKKFII